MKKYLFLFVPLIVLIGCAQKYIDLDFDSGDILRVEARVEDSFEYKLVKEIQDEEVVQSVIDIFNSERWTTNIDIDMADEPDFLLNGYLIWISPKGNHLTILKNGVGYVRLSEEYSSSLHEILVGKEL
ncbi:hypothetical protein [Ornithinibacillus halophilus]|uniref:Lipoprotein n=1 Tax=Ornithinibacillus halophilus TaxID=930117 RepID=A0A1M5JWX1_9BACI|nr:hypothetical protein [Ornithinibacillus halophilus]SHG45082.1 hypothetical protein SAMN05216225_10348 [Ornithinibacillus halophilus]